MGALDEIQAAIEKLTKLRDKSSQGWWTILDNGDRFIAEEDPDGDGAFEYIITEPVWFNNPVDADLIVALHRTIDAQLAILQGDMRMYADYQRAGWLDQWVSAVERAGDLALARAINGIPQ